VLMPQEQVWKTGRQVSKSTSIAAHGVVLSNCIPHFKTLYITPLYEQIRRFSNNYVRPFIDQSPVRSLWTGTMTENSVLQRSFRNLSLMLFSFALMDADRIRGISAHKVAIDEIQDMDPDHLPIINEVMSHSSWGLNSYTGTPKGLENSLEMLWLRSSQAEWFVPCFSCNTWNIPAREYHIYRMIGDFTPHISEQYPGTVCHKCRKPISPRHGHWVHKFRERRWKLAGYHVPQIIMPLHYANPEKWTKLLMKREGWGNTTEATFNNEVLGESVDVGQKLLSKTELQAAAVLPWENRKSPVSHLRQRLPNYTHRMMAIDWGGGGEEGVSFTVIAILGLQSNGSIDCLWGKRLLMGADHLKEAQECMKWCRAFNCDWVAHDYTGAGTVRETVMVQAGFDLDRIMAVRLCRSASQDIMVYKAPTAMNHRKHYSLDKTRSLLYTCQAIKMKLVKFFAYDWKSEDDPGLLHDFLALVENKAETRLAGDVYTITRNPMLTDDFAQAVNIGCASLWNLSGSWPNFAAVAGMSKYRVTSDQLAATGYADYGWDEDMTERYFGMP
jgi:hypothetical protein